MTDSAKAECEALMSALLPFAIQMLEKYGEFYPFAGLTNVSGEIVHVGTHTGDEHPRSVEVLEELKAGLKAAARAEQHRCTAVVFDVKVLPLTETEKTDAIEVDLEHRSGYSVRVYFPYTITTSGLLKRTRNVEIGQAFATESGHDIFAQDVN